MFRNLCFIIVLFWLATTPLFASALTDIDAVKVNNVTVYSQKHLMPLYIDLLGQPFDTRSKSLLKQRFEALYVEDGWIKPLVFVTQNSDWKGLVEVVVIEPRPTQLLIEGFKGAEKDLIETRVNEHLALVLSQPDIERFSKQLSLELEEDLECALLAKGDAFQIKIRPRVMTYGSVQISNANAEVFGREILDVYAGLSTPDTRLGMKLSNGLQESVYQYIYLGAKHRLVDEWSVSLSGSYEKAKPLQTEVGEKEEYSSQGVTVGTAWGGWERSNEGYRLRFSLATDDFEAKSQGEVVAQERLTQANVRLSLWQNDKNYSHWFGVRLSSGIDGLGASVSDDRPYNEEYTLVRAQYSHVFQLSSWVLQSELIGQWAGDTLPFSKRFSLGGEYYLRAFEDGQLSGDSGAVAQFQLGYEFEWGAQQIIPFTTLGYGKLWNKRFDDESASSVGCGVIWRFNELTATFEGHKPMSHPSDIEEDDVRVRGRLNYSF